MMKKLLVILATISTIITLSSCSGSHPTTTSISKYPLDNLVTTNKNNSSSNAVFFLGIGGYSSSNNDKTYYYFDVNRGNGYELMKVSSVNNSEQDTDNTTDSDYTDDFNNSSGGTYIYYNYVSDNESPYAVFTHVHQDANDWSLNDLSIDKTKIVLYIPENSIVHNYNPIASK